MLPCTSSSVWTRLRLAPAARSLGTITAPMESSADSTITSPGSLASVSSGIGRPVVSLAAMSSSNVDLPNPGSPVRSTRHPAGSRFRQNHSGARSWTSERVIAVVTEGGFSLSSTSAQSSPTEYPAAK